MKKMYILISSFFLIAALNADVQPEPLSKYLETVRNIKEQDVQDFKNFILEYYDGVTPLKSIQTAKGIIDCIPFEQQYSVRILPEKEKKEAIELYNRYNREYNKNSEKRGLCPAGYVPLPRLYVTYLRELNDWTKANSQPSEEIQPDSSIQEDTPKEQLPAGGTVFSDDQSCAYYWCSSLGRKYDIPRELIQNDNAIRGTYVGMRVPAVPLLNALTMGMISSDEHSLFQLWISNMESTDPFPQDFTCVECGYIYDTGNEDPLVFCFMTANGYRDNKWGGYNACSNYFVLTTNTFNFNKGVAGAALDMGFYYDPERGWVFVVNGEEVGYYRKAVFKNKMESVHDFYINYGGEVCQRTDNTNTVLMGNGRSDIFGIKLSAFIGYYVYAPSKVPEPISKMYDPDKKFIRGESLPLVFTSQEYSSSNPDIYNAKPYLFRKSPVQEKGLIIGGGLKE